MTAPMPDFGSHLYVFILAAFLGLEVIKRVSPLLHTPLMSLTNAIGQPSCAPRPQFAHLWHADSRCRPSQDGHGHQPFNECGFCRN